MRNREGLHGSFGRRCFARWISQRFQRHRGQQRRRGQQQQAQHDDQLEMQKPNHGNRSVTGYASLNHAILFNQRLNGDAILIRAIRTFLAQENRKIFVAL